MEALLSCARSGARVRGGTLYTTTFPCHNCAKHLVGAGIARVIFVEPYPKSKAVELHADALTFEESETTTKVLLSSEWGLGGISIFSRSAWDRAGLSIGKLA